MSIVGECCLNQTQNVPAGKVGLNLSAPADPVTGYVAMSRFKKADDVLIIQACLQERAGAGAWC